MSARDYLHDAIHDPRTQAYGVVDSFVTPGMKLLYLGPAPQLRSV